MNLFRRSLVVVMAVLISSVGGMLFLSCGLVADAAGLLAQERYAAGRAAVDIADLIGAMLQGNGTPRLLAAALQFIWFAVLALCFAPVTLAALLGEALRSRSLVFYAALSGIGAASVPTLARIAGGISLMRDSQAAALEARLTLLFFLTGVTTGCLYWVLAGRYVLKR